MPSVIRAPCGRTPTGRREHQVRSACVCPTRAPRDSDSGFLCAWTCADLAGITPRRFGTRAARIRTDQGHQNLLLMRLGVRCAHKGPYGHPAGGRRPCSGARYGPPHAGEPEHGSDDPCAVRADPCGRPIRVLLNQSALCESRPLWALAGLVRTPGPERVRPPYLSSAGLGSWVRVRMDVRGSCGDHAKEVRNPSCSHPDESRLSEPAVDAAGRPVRPQGARVTGTPLIC